MRCLVNSDGTREIADSPVLAPTEDECVFEVKACGICGSDIPRVFAGSSYYYPIVLGHEFAGVVKDSKNPRLIGKRACVFPILPCGECEFCKKEQWAACKSYDYYGSRRDGGLQSELMIKESNLIFLPDNVSFEGGSMAEPSAVCLHAVKKAEIVRGESSVIIYGAGTIGLLCGMWARAFGAKGVFFVDPMKERLEFAEKLGFSVHNGESADIAIEASGAEAAFNCAIETTNPMGRIVLVGHGGRDVTVKKSVFPLILRKQLTVCGSWNSDRRSDVDDWKESIDAISEGVIAPEALITHKIPLAESDRAFRIIEERKEIYNKITVVM